MGLDEDLNSCQKAAVDLDLSKQPFNWCFYYLANRTSKVAFKRLSIPASLHWLPSYGNEVQGDLDEKAVIQPLELLGRKRNT